MSSGQDISDYSERDVCTKLITPAILAAGWDQEQFREEVKLTAGRVVVRGNKATRLQGRDEEGGPKFADYVLYANPQTPLGVIEAKKSKYPVGHGMQQGLGYAERLDVPFAFSSNGDGFLMHDRTGLGDVVEKQIRLDEFPTYEELWAKYRRWKGWDSEEALSLIAQPNHDDGSGREPRYYLPTLYLKDGDVLFNRTNSWELVGKTGVFRGPDNRFTFASYLIRLRLLSGVYADFLNIAMNAPFYRETQINPTLTQQCGQANFNGTKMKNSLVPLAPTHEQDRIIRKANHLLDQCDRVSEQLRDRQATTEQLLAATIHRILETSEAE